VQAESYFQLLNPLVFLLFAAGFFTVNAVRPSEGVFLIALSYLAGATTFTVDIFNQAGIRVLPVIATTWLYAVTAVLVSAGLCLRYRGQAPWRLFGAMFVIHLAIYTWLFTTVQNYWLSSFSANFGCGAIFLVAIIAMRNHLPRTIDKVVFWLYFFSCVQCFIRPVLVAQVSTDRLTALSYNEPLFLMTLHFVVGACAVILGMALLVACSTEIIEDLQHRSITDRLSGVLNRRGFEDTSYAAFHADGKTKNISVLLADIDHFKRVNDTKGHAFGDMVIAELGALFNEYADNGRIAGRLGGEEFAILLIGEGMHEAKELADALRRDFANLRIDDGDEYRFSASFGVALRQPDESLVTLLARADEALYLSKKLGRNRVSCEADVHVDKLRTLASTHERRKNRDGFAAAR